MYSRNMSRVIMLNHMEYLIWCLHPAKHVAKHDVNVVGVQVTTVGVVLIPVILLCMSPDNCNS